MGLGHHYWGHHDIKATATRSALTRHHFTSAHLCLQVRRFFKAFRRFGCPLERLEAISTEAELQEKSLPELRRLGETIIANCQEAMQQQREGKDNGTAAAAVTPAPGETENGDTQKGERTG